MEREVAEAARTQLREQLFEALLRDNPLEVPQSMVEEQISEMQAQLLRRKGKQDAHPPAREALEAAARQRVALGLLIGEIVRSQGLKLDRARIEQRLEALIASYPDPLEARRQYLGSREGLLTRALKKLRLRSSVEIEHERFALKALRGDFHNLPVIYDRADEDALSRLEGEGGIVDAEPPSLSEDNRAVVKEVIDRVGAHR